MTKDSIANYIMV